MTHSSRTKRILDDARAHEVFIDTDSEHDIITIKLTADTAERLVELGTVSGFNILECLVVALENLDHYTPEEAVEAQLKLDLELGH
jgi:hypothetical protein